MSEPKVLLVDDEEEFTRTLAERMQARGLEVDVSGDGADAVRRAQGATYDAVILDLAMPGLDGIATLKLLLAQNPDLQVMLLTGHATLEKGVEAVKSGAIEFLEKPVDLDLLLGKIQEARQKGQKLREKRIAESLDDILRSKGW
jgi:DNA-binding NtrC family response regulator